MSWSNSWHLKLRYQKNEARSSKMMVVYQWWANPNRGSIWITIYGLLRFHLGYKRFDCNQAILILIRFYIVGDSIGKQAIWKLNLKMQPRQTSRDCSVFPVPSLGQEKLTGTKCCGVTTVVHGTNQIEYCSCLSVTNWLCNHIMSSVYSV